MLFGHEELAWVSYETYTGLEDCLRSLLACFRKKDVWCRRGNSSSSGATPKESLTRQFDLSEWSLWQDEAQKRHLVTESASSKILRSTLEGLRYDPLYECRQECTKTQIGG